LPLLSPFAEIPGRSSTNLFHLFMARAGRRGDRRAGLATLGSSALDSFLFIL
jgi:hypothetical protein